MWLLEQITPLAPLLSDPGPLYSDLTALKEKGEQGWASGFTSLGETGGLHPSEGTVG